jgi:hypothetical protein
MPKIGRSSNALGIVAIFFFVSLVLFSCKSFVCLFVASLRTRFFSFFLLLRFMEWRRGQGEKKVKWIKNETLLPRD